MKRIIIIEVMLMITFAIVIAVSVPYWENVSYSAQCYDYLLANYTPETTASFYSESRLYIDAITYNAVYGSLCLLAALATLAAMIIIAIKDFPVFKPLLDKLHARKEARNAAKAEKAEANKQARIEQLQAELDELKKDE